MTVSLIHSQLVMSGFRQRVCEATITKSIIYIQPKVKNGGCTETITVFALDLQMFVSENYGFLCRCSFVKCLCASVSPRQQSSREPGQSSRVLWPPHSDH